jgi:2-polyprenyl-3-methyl-5-hydroxy-6-metoxy-1,4-benzoquinol methylase
MTEENQMDDLRDIAAYYNNDPERENSRLERHQLEFDLTWRYLTEYLPVQGHILEVGAATGRYTLGLAKRGYRITAVDMSKNLLEIARKRIQEEGVEENVSIMHADARDLNGITKKDFDAVLLMGPLYHLVEEADRKTALKEAADHLKEGGILFSAFISRLGIMGDLLRSMPEWIENEAEVQNILAIGKNPDHIPGSGFRGYFAKTSEILSFLEATGFETLTVVGVEPAISSDDESYNRLQGRQRQLWLDLLHEISTEPSIIGASRHILYIGRKK